MSRLLLSVVLIALFTTGALAKPSVAVLGVEVTGEVDQDATTAARDLTEGMRSRAKIASGPFMLAPNSNRELIDEKVLHQCDNEAVACMAEIGRDLSADMMVYGKLAREGGGYEAILVVLDVKKRAVIRRRTIKVPPGANGDQVRAIAKKAYAELAGEAQATGTLVVRTNVPAGTLLIDDETRETITDGEATVKLPAGRYRVAIEADGYRRKEITVRVDDDDTTTETLELAARTGGDGGGGGGGIGFWKPAFGVTATATVVLGLYSLYAYLEMGSAADAISDPNIPMQLDQNSCATYASMNADLARACDFHDKHVISAIAAAGAGVLAVGSAYMAFGRGGSKPRTEVAITPTISPDSAGATLRFSW